MGCAGSKAKEERKADDAPENIKLDEAKGADNKALKDNLAKGASRMSIASDAKAREMFKKFRRGSVAMARPSIEDEVQLAKVSGGMMNEKDVRASTAPRICHISPAMHLTARCPFFALLSWRAVLSDIDDELFKFVFRLFDPNNTGKVDADAFVAGIALLTKGAETVDDQVEACFHMFDTLGNGVLTQPEFRAMMEATVALNLNRFAPAPSSRSRACGLRSLEVK